MIVLKITLPSLNCVGGELKPTLDTHLTQMTTMTNENMQQLNLQSANKLINTIICIKQQRNIVLKLNW